MSYRATLSISIQARPNICGYLLLRATFDTEHGRRISAHLPEPERT